ncbi:MAG: hypothetical protein AB1422_09550 [bacterium]
MKRLIMSLLTIGLFIQLAFAEEIMVSNITDSQMTISWVSDEPEIGLIKYGETKTTQIAYDDRGSNTVSTIHHITLVGLSPQTPYRCQVISGETVLKDFEITTGVSLIPTGNDLVYGKVIDAEGNALDNEAIVYLKLQDNDNQGDEDESALYSVLANSGGYWYTNLVNFRTADLTKSFKYSAKGDFLLIQVEGGQLGGKVLKINTKDDTPAPDVVLP